MQVKSTYNQNLLDHYGHPRNEGTLDNAELSCELDSPVCGDVVRLDIQLEDDRVSDIRFSGRGCIISMASASMLTERIKGKTVRALRALRDEEMLEMLGVPLGPVRTKCGLLPLRVLQAAIDQMEEIGC